MDSAELEKKIKELESKLAITEAKLQDKEKVFETILESTLAGFWDWYIQDNTEYLSPTFKRMFGYEDHEMENHPDSWQKIIHPEDLPGVYEVFNKHVASKGEIPYDNEVRYYHKDGSIVWVYCKGHVIEWDDNDQPLRMVGCHIDITPMKNAVERITHQQEHLSEKNKELEHFAYIASHDLSEPLRTVDSFVEILKAEYHDPKDENLNTYFNFIRDALNRMRNMIDSLLEYSRIGKNKTFEKVALNQLMDELEIDLSDIISQKNVDFTRDALPEVKGLPSELKQVFQNLILNAIKFQKPDDIPKIHVSSKSYMTHWEFCVGDNGIGVSEDKQSSIFRMFTKLHLKSEFAGQGIGLAFCKKIIEMHGGTIWLKSDLGKGSQFYFSIPKL